MSQQNQLQPAHTFCRVSCVTTAEETVLFLHRSLCFLLALCGLTDRIVDLLMGYIIGAGGKHVTVNMHREYFHITKYQHISQ